MVSVSFAKLGVCAYSTTGCCNNQKYISKIAEKLCFEIHHYAMPPQEDAVDNFHINAQLLHSFQYATASKVGYNGFGMLRITAIAHF